MTEKDTHLNTGEYDPKKYWDERARSGGDNCYQTVCVFRSLDCINAAADRIQKHFMGRAIAATGLVQGKALEVGCGVGRWADFVTGYGLEYTGADISGEMLAQARTKHPDKTFELIEETAIPFPDASFDLVFSVTVVQHNPYDIQERILAEMGRVLRPGGYLLILEAISHGGNKPMGFNMFQRTSEDWIQVTSRQTGASVARTEYIRYWILSRPVARVFSGLYRLARGRRLEGDAQNRIYGRFVNSVISALGSVDLLLQRLLPSRASENAVILFRKDGER